MFKFSLLLSVFLLTPLALKAALENNHKIDFWTNSIDEILIRFRFNKFSKQLEMQQDKDEGTQHLNKPTNVINDKPKKPQSQKNLNTKILRIPNGENNKFLEAKVIGNRAMEPTSTSPKTFVDTKETIDKTSASPAINTINPLSINACNLNCSLSAPHIACGHNWSFAPSCAPTAKVINLDDLQSAILYVHNNLRNHLAGNMTKFEPASRMATTQWHSELADYAELNVRQCIDEHDSCHRTKDFKITGQNLAVFSWSGGRKDIKTILLKMISNWYSENEYASQTDMDKFSSSSGLNDEVISHFTAIVNEKNTHVGCAAVSESNGPKTIVYFACNYARNNILRQAIYHKGKTASKCLTGTNPEYTNLCSINEKYEYNK